MWQATWLLSDDSDIDDTVTVGTPQARKQMDQWDLVVQTGDTLQSQAAKVAPDTYFIDFSTVPA